MIREKKTRREVSGNSAFIVMILLSVGIIILSTIVSYVQNTFGINHLQNIIYVILIVVAYFLLKSYLTEFRYSFFDDELIIEKILGKRITPIASIKSRDIEYFGKLADVDWTDKDLHVDYCDIYKRKAHVIKYNKKGEIMALTFSPSDELILHIQKSIEARDFDEVEEDKFIQ